MFKKADTICIESITNKNKMYPISHLRTLQTFFFLQKGGYIFQLFTRIIANHKLYRQQQETIKYTVTKLFKLGKISQEQCFMQSSNSRQNVLIYVDSQSKNSSLTANQCTAKITRKFDQSPTSTNKNGLIRQLFRLHH